MAFVHWWKLFLVKFLIISFLVFCKICIISYACNVVKKKQNPHLPPFLFRFAFLVMRYFKTSATAVTNTQSYSKSQDSILFFYCFKRHIVLIRFKTGKKLITWKRIASKICSFSQLWPSLSEIKCPVRWCATPAPAQQQGSASLGLHHTGPGGMCWVTFSDCVHIQWIHF